MGGAAESWKTISEFIRQKNSLKIQLSSSMQREFENTLLHILKGWVRQFVSYKTVQLQFPDLHNQTFTLLPCKIWNKYSVGTDQGFYPLQHLQRRSLTVRRQPAEYRRIVKTARSMFMRKRELLTQEGHWLSGSKESTEQLEWAVLSLPCPGENPRTAHVEKQTFHVNAVQTITSGKWKVISKSLSPMSTRM